MALLFELGLTAAVEPADDLLDEELVVGNGVESRLPRITKACRSADLRR
jgi:hypothetical protein